MINGIAIIVSILAMAVCAINGNTTLTIMNGFLLIFNVILLVMRDK